MKHITDKIFLLATAILALTGLSACDEVDQNDRYIELPAIEAKRVVLMEEFTGQMCVNCPEAHEVIAGLLAQYPDNFISVSIHGGGDAFSFSEEALPGFGLRNTEGQQYCESYNIAALPAAVVNRNSGVLQSDLWAKTLRDEMAKPSHVEIELDARYDATSNKVKTTAKVTSYENTQGGRLQLWIVESGIVSLQLTPSGLKSDYVHNHVYRGSINGHDGETVALQIDAPVEVAHEIGVRDIWNADNLSVVAFVYTQDGVLQAAETHVVK